MKEKIIIYEQIKRKIYRNKLEEYQKKKDFQGMYQRIRLLKEIIDTEKSYVLYLKELVKEYLIPLKLEKIIEEKEHVEIFSNIKEICKINSQFLIELEKEYMKAPQMSVCQVFKKYFHHFNIYTENINNYHHSTELITLLQKKNKKFNQFLENKSKKNQKRNINFYLIMPVQSII
jgi:hypothetical protein